MQNTEQETVEEKSEPLKGKRSTFPAGWLKLGEKYID